MDMIYPPKNWTMKKVSYPAKQGPETIKIIINADIRICQLDCLLLN